MSDLSKQEWQKKWDEWYDKRGHKRSTLEVKSKNMPTVEKAPSEEEAPIRCPKCKSTYISVNKKGFGFGKALTGGILFGGLGLLGGFYNSNKIKITCLKCGHSWIP